MLKSNQHQCITHQLKNLKQPTFTYCTLYKANLLKQWLFSLKDEYSANHDSDYFNLIQVHTRKVDYEDLLGTIDGYDTVDESQKLMKKQSVSSKVNRWLK